MKQKLKLSKVAKVATGIAFLFFCLLNQKIAMNNNENVGKADSNEALAALPFCDYDPIKNWGNCTFLGEMHGFVCFGAYNPNLDCYIFR